MLVQVEVLKEVLQDHVHIFQNTYFKNSQIHQPTTIYRFEHINQNILLIFVVSKSKQTLFACATSESVISSMFSFISI